MLHTASARVSRELIDSLTHSEHRSEKTKVTMSALSTFAELCSTYSSRGRWPDGIEAACTELVSAVIADRSVLELVGPFDALTAGNLLQHRGEYDQAATFLSRAYCGDAALRDSDEFWAFEHIDSKRWPKLLRAASCGNRKKVHDILLASLLEVFPVCQGSSDRPLAGAGCLPCPCDTPGTGEPATIINDAAVLEYVADRLLELHVDNIRMRFHSALWFAQRFFARHHAQLLISDAVESRDEGPIFPCAEVFFDSVLAATAKRVPLLHTAVEDDLFVELALLAAVSVSTTLSTNDLKHLVKTDVLWLVSTAGETIPFELMRLVLPSQIVDAVAAERDRLEKVSLGSTFKRSTLLDIERLPGPGASDFPR